MKDSEIKYPRYFVNIHEKCIWRDDTKYAYLGGDTSHVIFIRGDDGVNDGIGHQDLIICENNVKDGLWREVSEEEVVLL